MDEEELAQLCASPSSDRLFSRVSLTLSHDADHRGTPEAMLHTRRKLTQFSRPCRLPLGRDERTSAHPTRQHCASPLPPSHSARIELDDSPPQLVHLREAAAHSAENAGPDLARTLGPLVPFSPFLTLCADLCSPQSIVVSPHILQRALLCTYNATDGHRQPPNRQHRHGRPQEDAHGSARRHCASSFPLF